MGSRNITQSGIVCQQWAVDIPHPVHSLITDAQFPDGSKAAAQNFCRSPYIRGKAGVWCYTMDAYREWEFCDVCPRRYEGYNGMVFSSFIDSAFKLFNIHIGLGFSMIETLIFYLNNFLLWTAEEMFILLLY